MEQAERVESKDAAGLRRGFDPLMKVYLCYYTVFMVLLTLGPVPDQWMSVVNLISLIIGSILILGFLVLGRPFLPGKPLFPLTVIIAAFFLLFGITILANRNDDAFGNVKALLANAIQLLILFYYMASLPAEKARGLLRLIMKVFIVATIVIAAANIFVVLKYDIAVFNQSYIYAGLFSNPNNSSICAVSALCSLYLLRYGRLPRWFHFLNIVLQLIVVIICRSRACLIMLGVAGLLLAVAYLREKRILKLSRRVLMVAVITVAAGAILFSAQYLNKLIGAGGLAGPGAGGQGQGIAAPEVTQRLKEKSSEVRLVFMEYGLQLFLQHPVFGVGPRNVAARITELHLQEIQQGIEKGGVHNAYIQLLAANGAAGFLAVLALAAFCLRFFWRHRVYENHYTFAILAGLCVYALFEINVFFVNFPNSLIFWSMLGYSMSLARSKSGKEEAGVQSV